MAVLCAVMYWNALEADFQFDDEPNITKVDSIQIKELSWDALKNILSNHPARNRPLVNLSFALQHWGAQYVPEFLGGTGKAELVTWQFRLFNYMLHLLAGFGVYLLFLRLLQLPRLRGRFDKHLWPLATLAALVWFCSPVQVQSVTYIVQRAVSMAAMFYVYAVVCYLEARATPKLAKAIPLFTLCAIFVLLGLVSKEWVAVIGLALLAMEYLLLRRGPFNPKIVGLVAVLFGLLFLVGITWFYGKPVPSQGLSNYSLSRGLEGFWDDAVGKVLDNRPAEKIRITANQRLMTEARVVAMYESLLLLPGHWRLTLDYDFLETTKLFDPDECSSFVQILPLLIVLGIAVATALAPSRWRPLVFLLLLYAFTLWDQWFYAEGEQPWAINLSQVWRRPWPIPAITWHALLLGFAALYALRRPLLSFCIAFFYIGHLVESTVIRLEVVYEHRLYLPSIGIYLALVLLVYDIFYPPAEEDLGPRPLPKGWWKKLFAGRDEKAESADTDARPEAPAN